MIDFTISRYCSLIEAIRSKNYAFQPFREFLQNPEKKVVVLRQDVDAQKNNSLRFAILQHAMSIRSTFFFRAGSQSFDEIIIRRIEDMGHEIGYHYETMETCNGDVDKAYQEFCRNLEKFRKLADVKTICMHGSPRSKFDNKALWNKYDYRSLGIIGEPYFDIDFNEVAYLTDTGRRWNGDKFSVRDRVKSQYSSNFKSTNDLIRNIDRIPDKVMLTFHPQRWTNNPVYWTRELLFQNLKNQVKRHILHSEGFSHFHEI